jgi:hypothetical protein
MNFEPNEKGYWEENDGRFVNIEIEFLIGEKKNDDNT